MKRIWFYPESLFTMAFIPPKNIEFEKRYLFLCRFSLDCSCYQLFYFIFLPLSMCYAGVYSLPLFYFMIVLLLSQSTWLLRRFPIVLNFVFCYFNSFYFIFETVKQEGELSDRKSHEKYETESFVLVFRFSFTPWSHHRPVP